METTTERSTSTSPLSELVTRIAPHTIGVRAGRRRVSGFRWRDGLAITVEEAMPDEEEVEFTPLGADAGRATLAGRDPSTALALLRVPDGQGGVETRETPPLAGESVAVVGLRDGRPLVASGVLGYVGAPWTSLRGGTIDARLELDLSLPSDAEGGLVVDADGRALGMAVLGPRRRALVIPMATVERVAARLDTHGHVPRAWLGLALQPLRLDGGGRGLLAVNISAEGPAERAGLRQGDIVVELDGENVGGLRRLGRALGPERIGTAVPVRYLRGGEPHEAMIAVGERPPR